MTLLASISYHMAVMNTAAKIGTSQTSINKDANQSNKICQEKPKFF